MDRRFDRRLIQKDPEEKPTDLIQLSEQVRRR